MPAAPEAAEAATRTIEAVAKDVTGKMYLREVFAEGEHEGWTIDATTLTGRTHLHVAVEHTDGRKAAVLVSIVDLIQPAANFAIDLAEGKP